MVAINSYADEQLYDIELLIFAQDMPNTELFTQTKSLTDWPKEAFANPIYASENDTHIKLEGSHTRLMHAQKYHVLAHLAWTQSVQANQLSAPVQICNTEGTINGFFRLQRGYLINILADIEYSPDADKQANTHLNLDEGLERDLSENLDRHLGIKANTNTDTDTDTAENTDLMVYRLHEKRRFKLNEIHYLDHPKFGILARVSRITQEEQQQQQQ